MRPMLATLGAQPAGPEWLHEVKWDGMRVLVDVRDHAVRLFARSGRDVSVSYPELAGIGNHLQDALLDGEIIALADGIPSFAALAQRMHVSDARRAAELAERYPVSVMTFDLLRLYGVELLNRPLQNRRASLDQLQGPVGIAQITKKVADFGVLAFINLMAVLSVSIGLINLFPIPMLDGGHLLYYACEAVLGRPLGERVQDVGFRLGLVLVLGLMLLATWNDIARLNLF